MRIGQGYDVHQLAPGEGLPLGGVWVPCEFSSVAHSDGDVLLHAITDALLGALGLGDIGHHFPDTDPAYAGADSRMLLRHAYALIRERGYVLGNLDCTVIAQAPKLAGHIHAMRACIAQDLEVQIDQVSVKATTTEGLGFTGRKEGIAAQAIVLLHG
ncbi:MAG: 2-C-methyl-D-erythritol 2,4-cyclodiphosphate synthase [Litorivicinus sp.]